MPLGCVYDSNATMLAAAVRELGGDPVPLGIVPDDVDLLRARTRPPWSHDVVLLSEARRRARAIIAYRVVDELGPPGIIAHGIALKPGKPLCLGVVPSGVEGPAADPDRGPSRLPDLGDFHLSGVHRTSALVARWAAAGWSSPRSRPRSRPA